MGKRKSSSKPMAKKKREPLATVFQCLFCNHEKSVLVKMERKLGIGNLHCKVCGQDFQTSINSLSAAVDVYADWIDACDAVAKEAADSAEGSGKLARSSYRDMDAGRGDALEAVPEDDGFVVNDELDGEGDYGGDDD